MSELFGAMVASEREIRVAFWEISTGLTDYPKGQKNLLLHYFIKLAFINSIYEWFDILIRMLFFISD